MREMESQEVHVLLGCGDARDAGQAHIDAVNATIARYLENGVAVELHIIRAPGSFVTPDVVADIRRIFESAQRRSPHSGKPTRHFVHIQSHGQLDAQSDRGYAIHVHKMNVVQASPFNCGMLGASGVGMEIEQMLLEERPEVVLRDRPVRIDSEDMVRALLREVYAHDGHLAGDWIKSIDLLRTHPRAQRVVLERAIARDPDLRALDIKVTAGIQDYATHKLIRLDGGEPAAPFWDEVQGLVRGDRVGSGIRRETLDGQAKPQKPLAGLLCMSDSQLSSGELAAAHYLRSKGLPKQPGYMPNTLFNLSGSSFDVPLSPFGPYIIGGFFYAVKHLGLRDQLVMGHDAPQTDRILRKIAGDPIMRLIVRKLDVNLIPINHQALAAR